ncbi:MAG: iron ABC transporter permease [Betaproteobacteria bacterium]|nr:iron ABC transporter permease [Betaproteobacteria bacterium]
MQHDITEARQSARILPRERIHPGVAIASVVLALVLGYPIFLLVTTALNVGDPLEFPARVFGTANIIELAEHTRWITNTLFVATGATILALALGVTLAWILHRTMAPAQRLFELLIAIPYPLGPLVCALAWLELGAPQGGVINRAYRAMTGSTTSLIDITSPWGIIFVLAISEVPVAVLMIGAAMQRMDPALEESSAVFGANTLRTAMRVTIPLMAPAILSATLFLFTSMLGAFAIPAILGASTQFYVATTAIFVLFQGYPPNYPLAAALGLVLVFITAAGVWANNRILRGRSFAVVGGKNYRPRLVNTGRWTPVLVAIEIFYVLVALVLPIGMLIFAAIQKTTELRWSPEFWSLENFHYILIEFSTTRWAILNSVGLGIFTGIFGVLIATLLAWMVHRSYGRGRGLLEQLAMSPQAFPRLIFAFALLWTLLSLPFKIYGTVAAVLIAYLCVFMPLAYRSMSGVIVQIHPSLEEASRVAGAGWARTISRIVLPLLRPGIVATWALLFMVSVREVSASIFLASSAIPVLGPAILNFWDSGGLPKVSALTLVQAFIIIVCMIIVRRITQGRTAIAV